MQVKYILGYNIPHVDRIQDLVYNLVANAHQFKWREFVMGVAWIVLLLLIKNAPRWHKWVPPATVIRCRTLAWSGSMAVVWHEPSQCFSWRNTADKSQATFLQQLCV